MLLYCQPPKSPEGGLEKTLKIQMMKKVLLTT